MKKTMKALAKFYLYFYNKNRYYELVLNLRVGNDFTGEQNG